ncbi:MAG: hypothetical protein KA034_01430 [Candidatus Moranbacteria bacterium]|nr:hypothetical protein [Candidatus Moranbacteria bacterium]
MRKIVPYIILFIVVTLLEISWSSFFSFQERPYFFLFSLLAIWVVKKGFIDALPLIVLSLVMFEGITQSTVGPVSFYGVLFSYGISFLLRRVHLEYGVERVFLSLAIGIGIALYPVFLHGYTSGWMVFSEGLVPLRGFLQNMIFGGALFLAMLSFSDRSRESSLPLASSFSK